MPVELTWYSREILAKQLRQIIAISGDGKLRDGNVTSEEFREFLKRLSSGALERYAGECLHERFDDSGLALQDLVNRIGTKLDFEVAYGRYRGTQGEIGYDGLWRSPLLDGHAFVVEVKTTDSFRIDLDTPARYRRQLIDEGEIEADRSSILIVVGRADTDSLEAQIRGSRHAWDLRLISVEALIQLMHVREDLEDPRTVHQIHQILVPREFTRVDGIIDILFSATQDLAEESEAPEVDEDDYLAAKPEKKFTPVAFHEACVQRIGELLGLEFQKKSRASFYTPEDDVRLVCYVSREQRRAGQSLYWFAFQPHQESFLRAGSAAYVAFGCGSPEQILLVPFGEFADWIERMNVTDKGERTYRHVHIHQQGDEFSLRLKADSPDVDLTPYRLAPATPPLAEGR